MYRAFINTVIWFGQLIGSAVISFGIAAGLWIYVDWVFYNIGIISFISVAVAIMFLLVFVINWLRDQ